MKLNKILMSTLVGCALLTPVILSSCSIKNYDSSSNDEEQKPKTIPVPFQSSLYDTWSPRDNFLIFSASANTTYEIQSVEGWLTNELNNGRNFEHKEEVNEKTKNDVFSVQRWDSTLHQPLFKTIDDFYTWIKKSENNYEIQLNPLNDNNDKDKWFNFKIFNWDFITNPNCYVYIYIYIYIYILMIATRMIYQ